MSSGISQFVLEIFRARVLRNMRLSFSCLIVVLLVVSPQATPTTMNPATVIPHAEISNTGTTTVSTSTAMPQESTASTKTTNLPSKGILRQQLPVSQRLRGRVVLANTRMEGSTEWGVTADQAELACNRIARYQSEDSGSEISPIRSLLERLLSAGLTEKQRQGPAMSGHLLSIGSSYEVLSLSRLLSPLPDGAYWTGGKLIRYRVNNMHRHAHTDHVVLTWTDGRVSQPSVLGLTRLDEEQLKEGYTYCLALNLKEATWQARDCDDRLPYACLITPRQIGFANKARVNRMKKDSTESPTTEEKWIRPSTDATVSKTSESIGATGDLLAGEMSTDQSSTLFPMTGATTVTEPSSAGSTSGVTTEGTLTSTFSTEKNAHGSGIVKELLGKKMALVKESRDAADKTTQPVPSAVNVAAVADGRDKDERDDDDEEEMSTTASTSRLLFGSAGTKSTTTEPFTPTAHVRLIQTTKPPATTTSTAGHIARLSTNKLLSEKRMPQSTSRPSTGGLLEEKMPEVHDDEEQQPTGIKTPGEQITWA